MNYRWRAVYSDGTWFDQRDDVPSEQICRVNLTAIWLIDQDSHPLIKLTLNHNDILFYRRRNFLHVGAEGENTKDVWHILGKRSGDDHKIIYVIDNSGFVEFADKFNDNDVRYASIKFIDTELIPVSRA